MRPTNLTKFQKFIIHSRTICHLAQQSFVIFCWRNTRKIMNRSIGGLSVGFVKPTKAEVLVSKRLLQLFFKLSLLERFTHVNFKLNFRGTTLLREDDPANLGTLLEGLEHNMPLSCLWPTFLILLTNGRREDLMVSALDSSSPISSPVLNTAGNEKTGDGVVSYPGGFRSTLTALLRKTRTNPCMGHSNM